MNRWSALAVLLAIAAALALRVPKLAIRPLHNDEAVNAVKVTATGFASSNSIVTIVGFTASSWEYQ